LKGDTLVEAYLKVRFVEDQNFYRGDKQAYELKRQACEERAYGGEGD